MRKWIASSERRVKTLAQVDSEQWEKGEDPVWVTARVAGLLKQGNVGGLALVNKLLGALHQVRDALLGQPRQQPRAT